MKFGMRLRGIPVTDSVRKCPRENATSQKLQFHIILPHPFHATKARSFKLKMFSYVFSLATESYLLYVGIFSSVFSMISFKVSN